MYSIFDETSRKHYVNDGIDVLIGEWVFANTKLTKFDDEFDKELEKNRGFVYKAQTLDALAKAMGVDASVLKETIDQNNVFAAQNVMKCSTRTWITCVQ